MGIVLSRNDIVQRRRGWKQEGKRVVFTNGVFDILHRGHVEYLTAARALGEILVVGVNTDDSVRRIKGPQRPIVPEEDRAFILASLACVDAVCLFGEDTPADLIAAILPDVLVKGADYTPETIVGKDIVERNGGTVRTIDLVPDRSTTNIVERIVSRFAPGS